MGKASGTHCIGGWVGLRVGLDAEVRGKILCLCRGSNPGRPVRSQTLYWLSYPAHVYQTVLHNKFVCDHYTSYVHKNLHSHKFLHSISTLKIDAKRWYPHKPTTLQGSTHQKTILSNVALLPQWNHRSGEWLDMATWETERSRIMLNWISGKWVRSMRRTQIAQEYDDVWYQKCWTLELR
jgi:hypothetical protein